MSVFIGYPSFMAYQMMKGNNEGFPSIPGMIARYSALGLTNEQMAANPVWADKTRNGRDLQLKNFAWKRMSGVGGYVQDFNDFKNNSTVDKIRIDERGSNSIKVTILTTTGMGNAIHAVYIPKNDYQFNKSYFIKISSEGYDEGDMALSFYPTSASTATTVTVPLNPNGITEIPAIKKDDFLAVYIKVSSKVGSFTVEQLPLYPGALVFDGVDDYGVCENFPILTKEKGYTVVALRQWITRGGIAQGLVSNVKNWLKDGAFLLEYRNIQADHLNKPISFGAIGSENDLPHILTYQTSKSYNGVSITTGNFEGTDVLHVGKLAPTQVGTCINAAIWELVILDHDATEEELTKIKNYFIKTYPWLFFDQAWTVVGKSNEDTDRATIANITGNGNDLVLSNFGFSGNSGYGEYAYNWNTWKINEVDSTKSNAYHNRMEITLPAIGESSRTQCNFYSPLCEVGTIYDFSFKISGLTDNSTVFVKPGTIGGGAIIAQYNKDGVYHLNYTLTDEAIVNESTQNRIYFFIQNFSDEEMNLTIEQIPDHEGYLVTDGVDDKITSSAFTLGKKFTVVGENKILSNTYANAGLVKVSSFLVFPNSIGVTRYINRQFKGLAIPSKRLKSICSDGRIYYDDWADAIDVGGNMESNNPTPLFLGYQNNEFTRFAFKNLAIYNNKTLSKEDAIKAYIYLQTLKAK